MHITARFEEGKRSFNHIHSFIGNHRFFHDFFGHELIFNGFEQNKEGKHIQFYKLKADILESRPGGSKGGVHEASSLSF